ncbi:MAG: ATP-binding protein, partial [Bacteroidota bacterium]
IFITAYSEENLLNQARLTNPFAYIVKPINERELYATIELAFYRHEMETKFKSSEEKFKNFIQHSPDIIYKFSNLKGTLFLSDSVQAILGYSPEEILNNSFLWNNSIHPDDKMAVQKAIKDHEKGADYNIEYRIKTKSGKWVWLQDYFMYKSQIDDEIFIEGHAADITKRKEAELDLKESEQKLKILNSDKNRFISILGHDLRSPFIAIIGFVELLLEGIHNKDMEEIEKYAIHINQSTTKVFQLLENLLTWANAQSDKVSFNPQKLGLKAICNDAMDLLTPGVNEKNISINYLPNHDLNVMADTDMLNTVMRNLISNAIKYTNSGGIISINAEQNDSNIIISVTDNGIGIAPKEVNKLFDFSRTHSTLGTAKEKGTGLGLLLCKEFVEKHGGKIWVESELRNLPAGKAGGSSFKFTIPINDLREND